MNNMQHYPDSYKFPLLWKHSTEGPVKMYFPDLPGCGFTVPNDFKITDALEKASDRLANHLHQMELDNKTIPAPTPLHKLDKEPGTGIYIIAQMTKYRNPWTNKKNTQPVVTQLSILDFSRPQNNHVPEEVSNTIHLNTFKRESYQQTDNAGLKNDSPEKNNAGSFSLTNKTSFPPAKGITQLSLWKTLVVGALLLLIGASILNFNKNAGSYKPLEVYYSQRPAAAGSCNTN